MSKVIFSFNQILTEIQCNENELMENICLKFANKIGKNINSLYFIYSANIIDLKLPFKKVINNSDKKNKYMKILVDKIDTIIIKSNNNKKLIKAKQIICPICLENAFIEIENYKIKLTCNKGHESNILISEYEKTQYIDQSKIICDICKEKNKAETYNNQFFKCLNCKNNFCPLCNTTHDTNHNIINYDQKDFICEEHFEKYEFYCKSCKKNLCTECIKFHNKHEIITFGLLLPDQSELKKNLEKNQKIKDNFIKEIKEIIKTLEKLIYNTDTLFKINKELANNYLDSKQNKKLRNYEMIKNINYFSFEENKLFKDMKEAIDNENKNNKIKNIFNIYGKMEDNAFYRDFKNLEEYHNILYKICYMTFDDFEEYSSDLIEIFKPFKNFGENCLLSIISKKFQNSNLKVVSEFTEHLNSIEIYDEYKKELINKFSCKTKKICDSKDGILVTDLIKKIYGQSNLACFLSFSNKEEGKIYESKNLIFLNGKLELKNNNFNFENYDTFFYGNFRNTEDDNYRFISFQRQNSSIFAKIKEGLIYAVFDRDFNDKYIEKALKIENNFMNNKILYIIDWEFERLLLESFEKYNSFDKVDDLFEIYDSSMKCEAYLKEFIIYQIDNNIEND